MTTNIIKVNFHEVIKDTINPVMTWEINWIRTPNLSPTPNSIC